MKKALVLISILVLVFAVSCSKKKDELPGYEEQVSKKISAEEGGKVESSDGKTSIEIPGGALDEDTTITMTIYDISGYAGIEGEKVVSKVVEFEPSGTIFKKPVIISMTTTEAFENKIVSAAVFYEKEGRLSYSEHGAYAIMGRDAAGDPIMTTAAGDPIMLSDGNLTTGAGDPIMNAAAGDPIMLASAGDPIMTSAAGDPIMNSAAGDPIMMTTGHFTAYTFIVLDPKEPEKEPEEPEKDEEIPDKDDDIDISDIEISDEDDDDIPDEDDDIDISDEDDDDDEIVDEDIVDEDIVPEPALVFSKVLCTGQTVCTNGMDLVECPKEGEPFYGQDAHYIARGSCIPKRFTKLEIPYSEDGTDFVAKIVKDENTNLMWLADRNMLPEGSVDHEVAEDFCENLNYGGYEDWRLPNPKEFLSITESDSLDLATKKFYFSDILLGGSSYWTSAMFSEGDDVDERVTVLRYSFSDGTMYFGDVESESKVICVRGGSYGTTGNFTVNEETVWDSDTNLLWQKEPVSGKTWQDALVYCEGLESAGYSDWRLPNRNELASLVDYSKSDPASSFPGMTSNEYWVSTFRTYYGGQSGVFYWDMEKGQLSMTASSAGSDSTTCAVLCVRSDLKAKLPEPEVYPCDATGHGPCRDANGNIWSSRIINDNKKSSTTNLAELAEICRYRGEAASNKWRIPTISELRTMIPEGNLSADGLCGITDVHSTSENCSADPTETTLYDYGYFISGTIDPDNDDLPWTIDTAAASIQNYNEDNAKYYSFVGRCLLDDTLNYEKAPYFDSANALYWSNISDKTKYWYEAAAYCKDLVEDGSNNWRVPTMEELQKLVKNSCEEYGGCPKDLNGKYSVLGDIASLWSSEVYDDYFGYTYDFATAQSMECIMSDETEKAKVRCVRGAADQNEEARVFPQQKGSLEWSKISDKVFTFYQAESYCTDLNTESYDGKTDWYLPALPEVSGLINENCGNKDEFNSLNPGAERCSKYKFDGYSVFGDMVPLVTASQKVSTSEYFIFDFARGKLTSNQYPSGYVRCVRVLEM